MRTPRHPGRLVKDDIEALGLSAGLAAQGLGDTRQQLYRVIKGECAISPEMAVRLEKGIGSSAPAWLRMQMNYDLATLRERSATIAMTRLTPDAALSSTARR
jgi:addiction module HigA family antidote